MERWSMQCQGVLLCFRNVFLANTALHQWLDLRVANVFQDGLNVQGQSARRQQASSQFRNGWNGKQKRKRLRIRRSSIATGGVGPHALDFATVRFAFRPGRHGWGQAVSHDFENAYTKPQLDSPTSSVCRNWPAVGVWMSSWLHFGNLWLKQLTLEGNFYASKLSAKNTVDGRNPAPVDRYFIPLFTVWYIPGGCFRFLPSIVVP